MSMRFDRAAYPSDLFVIAPIRSAKSIKKLRLAFSSAASLAAIRSLDSPSVGLGLLQRSYQALVDRLEELDAQDMATDSKPPGHTTEEVAS